MIAQEEAKKIITRVELNHMLDAIVARRDDLLVHYIEMHPELRLDEIAEKFALTQPEVSRIMKRHGVQRPRGWASPAARKVNFEQ
jgi:DNA-directed RNA polymerase specialized sigma54-like protein